MNPFLKLLINNMAGALLVGLDAGLQAAAHPTGGFAAALNSAPAYATLYAVGLNAAHVLVDQVEAKMGIHPAQTNGG